MTSHNGESFVTTTHSLTSRSMDPEKENAPFVAYQPGNLDAYREQIRMRLAQSARHEKQVHELDQLKKSLDASTPKKLKPAQQCKQQTQSGKASKQKHVPDFQKKFQMMHQREQERIQKFQQNNRRQTIARAPNLGVTNQTHKQTSEPATVAEQDTEFMIDHRSLDTILGHKQRPNVVDTRQSMFVRSTMQRAQHDCAVAPREQHNVARASMFGGQCRVIPMTQLYGIDYDRRGSLMPTQTPLKTPDRHAFAVASPRTRRKFLHTPKRCTEDGAIEVPRATTEATQRTLDFDCVGPRAQPDPTDKDLLRTVLEQQAQLPNQPVHVQAHILNLLHALRADVEPMDLPVATPRREQPAESTAPTPRREQPSTPAAAQPRACTQQVSPEMVYEPSDFVKKLLSGRKSNNGHV